jgi:hypothetical protein
MEGGQRFTAASWEDIYSSVISLDRSVAEPALYMFTKVYPHQALGRRNAVRPPLQTKLLTKLNGILANVRLA